MKLITGLPRPYRARKDDYPEPSSRDHEVIVVIQYVESILYELDSLVKPEGSQMLAYNYQS